MISFYRKVYLSNGATSREAGRQSYSVKIRPAGDHNHLEPDSSPFAGRKPLGLLNPCYNITPQVLAFSVVIAVPTVISRNCSELADNSLSV
jgi:hypothetical protein